MVSLSIFLKHLFIYLAEPGLGCGTQDLWYSLQRVNLWLWLMGSSSMTRDRIPAPYTGTTGPSAKSHSKVFLLQVKTVKTSACPSKDTELGMAHWPCPHKRTRPTFPFIEHRRTTVGKERGVEATDTGVCRQWTWEGRTSSWDGGERQQMDLKAEISETGWTLREGLREIRWQGEVPMGHPSLWRSTVQGWSPLFVLPTLSELFFWDLSTLLKKTHRNSLRVWKETIDVAGGTWGKDRDYPFILQEHTHTHAHTHTHTHQQLQRPQAGSADTHSLSHTHTHTPISSCRDPRLAQQTHTHTHAHTHPSAAAEAPGWLSGEGPLRDQAVRLSSFYLPYQWLTGSLFKKGSCHKTGPF